jgi:cell wall-associated NlpC family hydrolase
MIGNIIQSYLVSLGVQIDKPGFQQADATIKQTGENIDRVTAGMARNFVKASTIIASAMASVTASAVGLMRATAKEDLAMQKYARTMMMSEQAAWDMKKATDVLGESINDITLTPELVPRFNKLSQDGSQMMVGGDFKETMKNFRDLMFEFTRLKQEASYALNWVGYYLMKYLQKPLADIREKFKTFNDMVIKNMSVWTEKVARAIYYVIEVGRHLLEFIMDIGRHLKNLWDSFPSGVKKAIAAITALQVALSAGPLGRAIMLISTLLLLIDDYYGYMEGKDALLGKYWDKLNNFLDTAKQKYEELKATVEPYWEKFVGYVEQAKKWFDELMTSIDEWSSSTGAEMFQGFIDECREWWQILTDIYDVLENSLKSTWKTFMEEFEKNDTIKDVRKALESVWGVFKLLYNAVKDTIRFLIRLYRELEKTAEFKEFREAVADVVDGVVELFGAIIELVETALKALFGEFGKTDKVYSFRDALRTVFKILSSIFKAINWVIRGLTDLFKLVARNKTFKAFWESIGKAIDNVISKIGRFSRAMLAFLHGDVKKAKRILDGEDEHERKGTRELSAEEKRLEPLIQKYAKEYDLDPNLLRAVGKVESNLDQGARSSAGAIGIMQLTPDTAAGLGVNPYDEEENIKGGAKYLRQMIDQFGSERLALAAYNAGPGAVKEHGGIPPYKETQNYVEKVLKTRTDYESSKKGNLAGDTVAGNAMDYEVGVQWMGGATSNPTIQCDSFTANVYNESGIKSIGGHSTDNAAGNVINDLAFKAAGAWHEGDNYQPQNGDLVGWNWSETSGHYGIYNADEDIVITRDSKGGIQQHSMREAIALWGNPTGYGSLSEALRNDAGEAAPQKAPWDGIPSRPESAEQPYEPPKEEGIAKPWEIGDTVAEEILPKPVNDALDVVNDNVIKPAREAIGGALGWAKDKISGIIPTSAMGNYNPYFIPTVAGGFSGGAGIGAGTVNVDIRAININAANKTNEQVGQEVADRTAAFFLNQSLAQPRIVPGPETRA